MLQSIFLKITFLFIVIFTAMSVGFYSLHQQLTYQHEEQLKTEASKLLLVLRRSVLMPPPMRKSFLRDEGYSIAEPHPELIQTMQDAFTAIPDDYPAEIKESLAEGRIRILKDEYHLYVYLTKAAPPLLVFKAEAAKQSIWPAILFGTLLTLLLLFYLLIIKTLFPLRALIQTIDRYGANGLYQPIRSRKKDEIALVSNALDHAMQKNQSLLEARRLFLRNIMHELKTPITVGKLALPFLKKSEEKTILERAFVRMEHLIQELVRVEQITSGTLAPNISNCSTNELIEKASNLLFLQPESIQKDAADMSIQADCGVMVIVFKNLIDNAIKYSPDHTVRILRTQNRILFANHGEPWPTDYTLERLSEPFFHHQSASHSFGLGLYIVKSIIEAHGYAFSHSYNEGEHRFILQIPPDPKAY